MNGSSERSKYSKMRTWRADMKLEDVKLRPCLGCRRKFRTDRCHRFCRWCRRKMRGSAIREPKVARMPPGWSALELA